MTPTIREEFEKAFDKWQISHKNIPDRIEVALWAAQWVFNKAAEVAGENKIIMEGPLSRYRFPSEVAEAIRSLSKSLGEGV